MTALVDNEDDRLLSAARALLEIEPFLWLDEAMHFSCREIEAIADLYRAVGHTEIADRIIEAHAPGDDVGDDHYQPPTTKGDTT